MASSSPADVHVLLVDDDRVTRMIVAGLLRKCNYRGASPRRLAASSSREGPPPSRRRAGRLFSLRRRRRRGDVSRLRDDFRVRARDPRPRERPRPLSGIVRRRPSRPLSFLTRPLPLLPVPPPEPTSVTSASSGREAIDLLERGSRFNLLLTDVMMPDVDGPALLHHVRNNEEYREMPVVMMSSNEHADIVLNCIRLGAEDYLLKPVSKKAVKHMWAHVWRRKQRFQMVPSLENQTREAEEEERFDQQMAAGNLVVDHEDIDGALPVPSTEEYSSDGGSDEEMEDETQADEARAGPGFPPRFVASPEVRRRVRRRSVRPGCSDPDAPRARRRSRRRRPRAVRPGAPAAFLRVSDRDGGGGRGGGGGARGGPRGRRRLARRVLGARRIADDGSDRGPGERQDDRARVDR